MRFDELLNLLDTTTHADWVTLSPPRVEELKVTGEGVQEMWLAGHDTVAFLRDDLDVSVAAEVGPVQVDTLRFPVSVADDVDE